jgi:hypothetical protein
MSPFPFPCCWCWLKGMMTCLHICSTVTSAQNFRKWPLKSVTKTHKPASLKTLRSAALAVGTGISHQFLTSVIHILLHRYCNVMGGSIHYGHLLHINIKKFSSVQLPALRAHRTVPQWTDLLQQPHFSTCSTAVHFNRTVSGRLQHITQDRIHQQSILLLANTGPQDRTSQRFVFLTIPDPTSDTSCNVMGVLFTMGLYYTQMCNVTAQVQLPSKSEFTVSSP